MEKEWIPVIAALVGELIGGFLAVSGGLISGYFNRSNLKMQLEYQERLEAKKHNLSKIEELHRLLTKYKIDIRSYFKIRLMHKSMQAITQNA